MAPLSILKCPLPTNTSNKACVLPNICALAAVKDIPSPVPNNAFDALPTKGTSFTCLLSFLPIAFRPAAA